MAFERGKEGEGEKENMLLARRGKLLYLVALRPFNSMFQVSFFPFHTFLTASSHPKYDLYTHRDTQLSQEIQPCNLTYNYMAKN